MDQFRKTFNSHNLVKIPPPLYHLLVTKIVLVETYEVRNNLIIIMQNWSNVWNFVYFYLGRAASELMSELCDKLLKQCLLCNENLMKNLEQLDSVVSSTNLHVLYVLH